MASGESERFIVLGGRESRLHGEGTAKPSQSAQETKAGSRSDPLLPTSLREIARKAKRSTSYDLPLICVHPDRSVRDEKADQKKQRTPWVKEGSSIQSSKGGGQPGSEPGWTGS